MVKLLRCFLFVCIFSRRLALGVSLSASRPWRLALSVSLLASCPWRLNLCVFPSATRPRLFFPQCLAHSVFPSVSYPRRLTLGLSLLASHPWRFPLWRLTLTILFFSSCPQRLALGLLPLASCSCPWRLFDVPKQSRRRHMPIDVSWYTPAKTTVGDVTYQSAYTLVHSCQNDPRRYYIPISVPWYTPAKKNL